MNYLLNNLDKNERKQIYSDIIDLYTKAFVGNIYPDRFDNHKS